MLKSKKMMKYFILGLLLSLSVASLAADIVPFTANSIKYAGAGFVEIVGPGKVQILDKVYPYEKTTYIRYSNIDSISSIGDEVKGCMLHYSSEGYTENISLVNQTCPEVFKVLNAAEN